MTKSELISRISDRFPHLVIKDSQVAVELILDAIGEALTQGRRAEIRGFGSFTVHHRPARSGRNPKTGATVMVPEKHAPHYRPGAPLLKKLQATPNVSVFKKSTHQNTVSIDAQAMT